MVHPVPPSTSVDNDDLAAIRVILTSIHAVLIDIRTNTSTMANYITSWDDGSGNVKVDQI